MTLPFSFIFLFDKYSIDRFLRIGKKSLMLAWVLFYDSHRENPRVIWMRSPQH